MRAAGSAGSQRCSAGRDRVLIVRPGRLSSSSQAPSPLRHSLAVNAAWSERQLLDLESFSGGKPCSSHAGAPCSTSSRPPHRRSLSLCQAAPESSSSSSSTDSMSPANGSSSSSGSPRELAKAAFLVAWAGAAVACYLALSAQEQPLPELPAGFGTTVMAAVGAAASALVGLRLAGSRHWHSQDDRLHVEIHK
jgi:hypothetical protein